MLGLDANKLEVHVGGSCGCKKCAVSLVQALFMMITMIAVNKGQFDWPLCSFRKLTYLDSLDRHLPQVLPR